MTAILIAAAALATAQVTHEINRAYCLSLGDDSQLPWADAPEWQRDSAVKGVEFHIANPDADASASHDSWMDQKVAEGWVFGEVKDAEKKTHPCIVPFGDLPPEQQLKDVLFKATVHAVYPGFAAAAGHIDNINDDLEQAKSQIADLTGKLDAANKAAKTAKLSRGEAAGDKPRKIGPVKERMSIEDLREAISAADKIEILFGDGKRESGAAPVVVEGEAWSDHALGLMLREPVEIHGPAHGGQPYHVRGFALVLDGKQVAWSERPEPLMVGAGQKYQLSNDIFF